MKTGYDQHFKKVRQSNQEQSYDVELHNSVADLLRQKVQQKTKKRKASNKRKFPVMPAFSFLLVLALGILLFENFDSFESYLNNVEIGVGTAQAEEAKPAAATAATATNVENKTAIDGQTVAVDAKKADDSDYLFKLAERKKQLDQREEDLNKLAAQIEKQKQEVTQKLSQLEDVRSKISAALEERIKADDSKVDTLVQMYSNMKPQQAAKIFENLDEDLVIEILSRMKKKSAADILNLVKPEKAQVLAERYTGYRAPASSQ